MASNRILYFFPLLKIAALIICQPCFAADIPSSNELRLSMQKCIKLALENNIQIQKEGINPKKSKAVIIQQEAVFDPSLNMSVSKGVNENRSPSVLSGANVFREEELLAGVGVKKKLNTGATVELNFINQEFRNNSFYYSNNPYYESNLGFRLTQPLLENFGKDINEAQITIAIHNRGVSLLKLKQKMIEVVSDAQKTYWEIVYSRQFIEVKELLLKQAQDLLEINKAKVEVGKLPKSGIDILEAQSSIASRESDILSAQEGLKNAEDKLKKIINLLEEGGEQTNIIPLDNPTTNYTEPALADNIQTAIRMRTDYLGLQRELLIEKVNLNIAENQKKPNLNLIGEWGVNGLGGSYGKNLDYLGDFNYRTWFVGVNLEIPWGNRQAVNRQIEAQLAVEQKGLDIKDLTQSITLKIRETIRRIKTNRQRIQANKAVVDMDEKKLAQAQEKHRLGVENFTTHDILEYQTQLADAKINLLKVIIDYNNSLIDLGVNRGTLLEDNGVKIETLIPES